MTHAVCPGSFDPPTLGHLDVIGRVAALFDRVTVAVLVNPDKHGMFSIAERLDLLRAITTRWPNVAVDSFHGLLVDYCVANGIGAIVKGLRAVSDFDYELQMAQMNHALTGVQTLFLPTSPSYSYVSSSLVKQVAGYGGNVDRLLPEVVAQALRGKLTTS
ncbi:MAG: pantetheine-phosphate adenylyltransferase [Nakamurella sp.]